MAIGRVAGPLLYSNLDRQGVDLQFTTSNSPLLYLDFANFRAAINANTATATETFTVNGSAKLANLKISDTTISSTANITLAATGNVTLGNIAQVKIGGGGTNYLMTTDGYGNLSWQDIGTVSQELNLDGMHISLGTPSDGSLTTNAAYRYWTPATMITNAVDNLNQVMLNVSQGTFVGAVDFTSNITSGPSALTVSFTPTITGNANAYLWDFGDGINSTSRNPTHTYSNTLGGVYNVYFKAYNTNGTLNGAGTGGSGSQGGYGDITKTGYITLYTPAPIPVFTLNRSTINSLTGIQLTNLSQYATSYTIHWGDGSISNIANNAAPGGVSGGVINHTYANTAGDTAYQITLDAFSPTAGPSGMTVTSASTQVNVFSNQTPTFTANVAIGNNQHVSSPNGLIIGFVNTTATQPGTTATFPGNRIEWNFGDGTVANVSIGSNSAGDLGRTIVHAYSLLDPTVQQSYNATLKIYNGHSNSPFTSSTLPITVKPAPTSLFVGNAIAISDRVGDTAQVGYAFTDLDGIDRRQIVFTNSSFNTNLYQWNFGDGITAGPLADGSPGSPSGTALTHSYTNTGSYSVTLVATGANSLSGTDDTLIKSNYISILAPPAPPPSLNTKILTISSVGTLPLLASSATDNSLGSIVTPGTAVSRVTIANPIATNILANVYNAHSGSLTAVVNQAIDSSITLTGGSDVGSYGSLNVTEDKDAHAVDPTVYPSNFYKVFSGQIAKINSTIPVGYNTYQMTHTSAGNTNVLGFVKDDVTAVPVIDATLVSATMTTPGALSYISGVPYFSTGGVLAIHGLAVYNWIGQTYLNSTTPLTLVPGTVVEGTGASIVSQGKSYATIDGPITFLSAGIPKANTGKNSGTSYVLGSIPVLVNGTAASASKIKVQLDNVNGSSTQVELPVQINVYNTPLTGFDELNIPVSATLGGSFSDNGKRIYLAGAVGPTPSHSSAVNYYTSAVFSGNIPVNGTEECIQRFGSLVHSTTNFSLYLPPGPDLSGRSGTQYFRFAFRRTSIANFTVKYSGKISGLWISAPGTVIDTTSQLNGWLDGTQVYAGAGIPGGNVNLGGNGSNGCAKSAGDVIPVGVTVTNASYVMTLGSANSSDAMGNNILVTIALATGDSISSISIS
jgi:PKD repeat protein